VGLANPILLCNHLVELAIFLPGPGDIAEIAQPQGCLAKTCASDQSFEGDRVEALALVFGTPAELRVQEGGDVSQGVLHALSVGDAGIHSNQSGEGTQETRRHLRPRGNYYF
jgi:hypothetical protein